MSDVSPLINVLDFGKVKAAMLLFRILNNPVCKKIYQLLELTPGMTVTELFVELRLSQSVVSAHLARMRRHGFIRPLRQGKNVHYSINKERMLSIISIMNDMTRLHS